ncbi:MAG: hypothetical protein MN733_14075 [Nitrososphaera sp.]|nr:hypothetical protein [Nitrososphaera sp.]
MSENPYAVILVNPDIRMVDLVRAAESIGCYLRADAGGHVRMELREPATLVHWATALALRERLRGPLALFDGADLD